MPCRLALPRWSSTRVCHAAQARWACNTTVSVETNNKKNVFNARADCVCKRSELDQPSADQAEQPTARLCHSARTRAGAGAATRLDDPAEQPTARLFHCAHAHAGAAARRRGGSASCSCVPAAAALVESDYSQRRIKFKDHANEVISVLDMIGYPRVPTRGLLGFVIAKG